MGKMNDEEWNELDNKTIYGVHPEQMREAANYHEMHKGHGAMHLEMILILIGTLLVAQILLVEWKRRHHKSYQLVSLAGMWILPIFVCLKHKWWRFIFSWLLFSCITAIVVKKAVQKPIEVTVPRLVYKWFYFVYKLSYGLHVAGCMVIAATFLGVTVLFNISQQSSMDCGMLLIFYGMYFGVLGRDIAEISSDKMASHIGYYSKDGIPSRQLEENVCAVCGNKLLVGTDEPGVIESTYKLTCDHVFHEFCIRGWCIVGKKQTCPYCKEKVDLKKMFCNPWEKPHVFYGQVLDWLRWLVFWQPVILCFVQGIIFILGLE